MSLRLLEGTSSSHVRVHLFCRFRVGEEGFWEDKRLGTALLPLRQDLFAGGIGRAGLSFGKVCALNCKL
jgi:hypothetical protein